MKRGLIALLLVAAAVLAPAAPAATVPGLGGEQFTAAHTTILSCGVGDFGGSFRYSTTGTASGPYAGTFTETGTATVGPADAAGRHVVSAVDISFTIDSPAGQVAGSHQFAFTTPGVNIPRGDCVDGWTGVSASLAVFQNALRYTATIATPAGASCTATGPALLRFNQGSSVLNDSFSEAFYNDVAAPAPVCAVSDTTPPTLSVPAGVVADATSAAGAVVAYVVTASDDVDAAPAVACAPASGSTFPIGATTVSCIATDAAGNASAPATFVVTVRGAAEQVAAGLGSTLPGLAAKQRAILADLADGRVDAACGVLAAYANQVGALAGKKLAADEAAALLATVARVETLLGC